LIVGIMSWMKRKPPPSASLDFPGDDEEEETEETCIIDEDDNNSLKPAAAPEGSHFFRAQPDDICFERGMATTQGTEEYRALIKKVAQTQTLWTQNLYTQIRHQLGPRRFLMPQSQNKLVGKLWRLATPEEIESKMQKCFDHNVNPQNKQQRIPPNVARAILESSKHKPQPLPQIYVEEPLETDICFVPGMKALTPATEEYRTIVKLMTRKHRTWSTRLYQEICQLLGEDRRFLLKKDRQWLIAQEKDVVPRIQKCFYNFLMTAQSPKKNSSPQKKDSPIKKASPIKFARKLPINPNTQPVQEREQEVDPDSVVKTPQDTDVCFSPGKGRTQATKTYRNLMQSIATTEWSAEEAYRAVRTQLPSVRFLFQMKREKSWYVATERQVKEQMAKSLYQTRRIRKLRNTEVACEELPLLAPRPPESTAKKPPPPSPPVPASPPDRTPFPAAPSPPAPSPSPASAKKKRATTAIGDNLVPTDRDVCFVKGSKAISQGTKDYRAMINAVAASHGAWSNDVVYDVIREKFGQNRRFLCQVDGHWRVCDEEEIESKITTAFVQACRRKKNRKRTDE